MANQLAHGLLSRGVAPGDRIAVLAHNCLEAVVINYAVSKCVGIVVPANFRYKKDEFVYLINDCEPKLLLFGGDFSSLVEEAKPSFSRPVGLVAIFGEPLEAKGTLKDLMNGKSTAEPALDVDPASAFTITYTSGTTGAPKGVHASHSAFLNIYQGMVVEGDLQPEEVTLVNLPLEKKEEKTKVAAKAAASIADAGTGAKVSMAGWTAARIDQMDESELTQVPADVYEKYLQGALD